MRVVLSRRHLSAGLAALGLLGATGAAFAQGIVPFNVHPTPRPLPEIAFKDKDGKDLLLSNFKGRVILLNIWATWCTPCRREMPTLDRLQAELGGPDFEVVALSIDRAGVEKVKPFFLEIGLRHLQIYIDQSATVTSKLAIVGLPTTLLIDREGREVWRYVGPAEWDDGEWVQEIRKAIAAQRE